MPFLVLSLGILIWVNLTYDILITTLTTGGAGPITGRVANRFWKTALWIHHTKSNHRLLTIIGWVILISTALIWFSLAWVGWTFIFCAFDDAVVNATTKMPANIWERIYFTGYTLSTLGMGDYQPQGVVWQLATAIASANGFVLVTLAIAYLLPVISAVVLQRQIALYIASLGGTPDDIIIRAWNGKNFGQFEQHLISLSSMLCQMTESYLAYPILYYFHSVERSKVFVLSLVTLDDALTLFQYGMPENIQPDQASLGPARRATSAFLKTLKSAYIEPISENPPLPSLNRLKQQGIPTNSEQEFWQKTKWVTQRRRLLLALIKHDGWSWDAVASTNTTNRGQSLDDETPIDETILH